MTILVRGRMGRVRTSISFLTSAGLHGVVLGWVAFGPALGPPEKPRSLYDMTIRPHETKIIWYNLRERLPDVAPAEPRRDPQPQRARVKFEQAVVAGPKDDTRPPQRIFMPAPEVESAKLLPLPNVVAIAPVPRPVRPFTAPPPEPKPAAAAPALPEAPRVAANQAATNLPFAAPAPKPQSRAFTPPPEVRMQRQAALLLPDAPQVAGAISTNNMPIAAPALRPLARAFTPPPSAQPRTQPLALAAAPEIGSATPAAVGLSAIPRTFLPPPSRPVPNADAPAMVSDAPSLNADATGHSAEASIAIVGLNPSKTTEFPKPPGSRQAGFSAGPQPRTEGSEGALSQSSQGARVIVPGLLVQGGAKDSQPTLVANVSPTSRENLLAAARSALGPAPKIPPAGPLAARVINAPDPRLQGRVIYTVAIQMPNVTSYSGSWIVWFAEREPLPGGKPVDMKPPLPLRKVDPKYIQAAADERVEGKVRLSAVIRKDGHVEAVSLLHHLDDRLDGSAVEALAKWEFEPALRNGTAVDIDAVFEIPFRLAPKLSR